MLIFLSSAPYMEGNIQLYLGSFKDIPNRVSDTLKKNTIKKKKVVCVSETVK